MEKEPGVLTVRQRGKGLYHCEVGEGTPIRKGNAKYTFDIEELINANVFGDAEQQDRVRRIFAQEKSLFSNTASARQERETGALTGLLAE